MKQQHHQRGVTARSVRALACVIAFAVTLPNGLAAHQRLLRSTPEKGAQLSVAPKELRLVFNEPVELAVSRLTLIRPDGPVYLARLRVDPDSSAILIAEIAGALVAGSYTVNWQVVGSDGHPVRGEYSFTIMANARGLAADLVGPTAPGLTPPPPEHHAPGSGTSWSFNAESPVYAAVRWLTFMGLLVVIGVIAFRFFVLGLLNRKWDPAGSSIVGPAAAKASLLGLVAVAVLGVALFLRLFAQSYAVHGPEGTFNPGLVGTLLTRTLWGWGWLLQLAGTALPLIGFIPARRGVRSGWIVATIGAVLLAFTPALSGHAVAEREMTILAVLADGFHVLGAGGWLGGLLLVLLVGIPVALRQKDAATRRVGCGPGQRLFTHRSLLRWRCRYDRYIRRVAATRKRFGALAEYVRPYAPRETGCPRTRVRYGRL